MSGTGGDRCHAAVCQTDSLNRIARDGEIESRTQRGNIIVNPFREFVCLKHLIGGRLGETNLFKPFILEDYLDVYQLKLLWSVAMHF